MRDKVYHYGRPSVSGNDIARVGESLRREMISQGSFLRDFEDAFAAFTGAGHCLAVANGTCGLHLALTAMGVGPGDVVWTSPLTFAATGNAALQCGAEVDFVDIDAVTFNMDMGALEDKLARAERNGALPRVVIPVHFAGLPCDMAALQRLSGRYGFDVLEDACHALGARTAGEVVGGCLESRAAVFSLHPVKNITSGEGGLVTTNDPELYERMACLRTHGLRPGSLEGDPDAGPWHVESVMMGYNYKISEPQCALGLSQFGRLDSFLAKRRALAGRYLEQLPGIMRPQARPDDGMQAWHIFVLRADYAGLGLDRTGFYKGMAERGVNLGVHYYPLHMHPVYRRRGFGPGMFPEAERYYREAFTFPLHVELEADDVDAVCQRMKQELARI